jgi:hypothetical protein
LRLFASFQGAKTLTKEDIESVFSLYDRVSSSVSLPYHSRAGSRAHFCASISTSLTRQIRQSRAPEPSSDNDGWPQNHRQLNQAINKWILMLLRPTNWSERKETSPYRIEAIKVLARMETNGETIRCGEMANKITALLAAIQSAETTL